MQLMNMPGKISLLISTSPSPPQPQYIIIFLPPWIWCSLDLYWISEDIKTWIFGISLSFVASDPLKWGKTNFTATGTDVFSPGWIGSTSQMRKLTHVQAPWGLGPRAGPAHITQTVDKKKKGPYLALRPQSKRLRAESLPYRLVFKKTKQSWGPF